MAKSDDLYSASGAESLKRRIVKYWHDLGYIGVTANRFQDPAFPGLWFVRSNLVNGRPPQIFRR